MKMNLQFFGGRGAGLGSGDGGAAINILSTTDVWSYRHDSNNENFVDAINEGVRSIQNDFPDVMDTVNTVNASVLMGVDADTTLGFWDPSSGQLHLNANYTNVKKMNKVYDASVKTGFHPSRGKLTGTQAVAMHEMGHALTDHIGQRVGITNIDAMSKKIVDRAYRKYGGGVGGKNWAGQISKYATTSNAEAIAEAVADFYSNGSKAANASKAIMEVMRKW